MDQHV